MANRFTGFGAGGGGLTLLVALLIGQTATTSPHYWSKPGIVLALAISLLLMTVGAWALGSVYLGWPWPDTHEDRTAKRRECEERAKTVQQSRSDHILGEEKAAAELRSLLPQVRTELFHIRDELNRVMELNRYEGLLNIFWASTRDIRHEIERLDVDSEVFPAVDAAYRDIEYFSGKVDFDRIQGGEIRNSDRIERAWSSVNLAIHQIDAFLERSA